MTVEQQYVELRLKCCAVVVELIGVLKKKYSKDMYMGLMAAYILHTRLNLKWKAIYEIEIIQNESTNPKIFTGSYAYIHLIEHEMIEKEIRKKESSGLDVMNLMNFQKHYADFNNKVSKAFDYYFEFWSQLASEKPILQLIKTLGTKINSTNDEIKEAFDQLLDVNSNQVKTILLYGNYMKLVVNDNEEAEKVISKASNLVNSGQTGRGYGEQLNQLKYSDATNLCIVVCSGDHKSMGVVKSVNAETVRTFGFSTEELKGNTVDTFMPKIFADHHSR